MDFTALKVNTEILEILKSNGIETPTEIQTKTYPLAANGYDVIGISQTGSGKTLAFVLPIISQILASNKPFHTLIIAPTREVTQQIAECIQLFSSLGIRSAILLGGEPISTQATALTAKPQIVVGTPGRIAKHITKTKNFKIGMVRKLVLDEADRFFEFDFLDDLNLIAEKLVKKTQALMFTATLTDKTRSLAHLFMKSPRIVQVSEGYAPNTTLAEYFTLIPEKYKLTVLCNYMDSKRDLSAIVFVSMCTTVQKLTLLLKRSGISSECLHGNMPQPSRQAIIANFRERTFNVLISTDLASRGLDIPHVDLVINFDLPNTARDYTHRVGRTARAGKTGTAITFVTQYTVGKLQRLEYALKRKLPPMKLRCYDHSKEINERYEDVASEICESLQVRRK